MDEQRLEIFEDLSGVIDGEIRCDDLTVAMYSTDASLYEIAPLGVAFPRHRDDVIQLARYASQRNIPLFPRGAGSGLAGQALGEGIVVDFSRHMRAITAIGDRAVRVQPGVVCDELNRTLREHGRYFPPDPSNSAITTVGGMLAVDAAGSRSVRVGSVRDHVRQIELVLAEGTCVRFEDEPLAQLQEQSPAPLDASGHHGNNGAAVKRTIVSKLASLLADNAELIEDRQPPLVRNCAGYYLRNTLSETHLNLPRLLIGSEGTLGLFTEAVLHTAPLPKQRGIVLLLFGRLESAVTAVQACTPLQPSACDLLDRRILSLARDSHTQFSQMISANAEAGLIVEVTAFNERQSRDRIGRIVRAVREAHSDVLVAHEAYEYEDVEFLWSLPRRVVPMLSRLHGQTRPVPFVEDVAVPPESLHEFLVRAFRVFQKFDVTVSLYAHAAAGQLHLRPFLPPPSDSDARLEAFARELYEAVFAVGGTISGEHGDGLSRTAFIRSQYGPLYRVLQQVKDLFDPHNLMNPGKIISDDPHVTIRDFRRPIRPPGQLVPLQLEWSHREIGGVIASCNGCGNCRTQDPLLRMCPFFRIQPDEATSPRSKANVARFVLDGRLNETHLASSEMKRLADYCFNCQQCRLECPSNVDIPGLVLEARAQYVAANGLTRSDWILSRANSFGALGSALSGPANWMLGSRVGRWLLEKVLGIHRRRKLPRFARKTFLATTQYARPRSTPELIEQRPVVYFVDHYVNHHDPELGHAFVEILRHNGIDVYVPPAQTASGMAMVCAGDLDAARKLADRNVRELSESAREGLDIVCTEPAAALCLKQEYPRVIDHPDVETVADRVQGAGDYLLGLHRAGRLDTRFGNLDLNVGYHTPCHVKALSGPSPLLELLGLIPGLQLHRIELGCSGMAGAFGLTARNFETSLEIGAPLIERMQAGDLHAGTTECSSCKIQMEQGTAVPTVHPLKLLALAYGLMPELKQRLNQNTRKLLVT